MIIYVTFGGMIATTWVQIIKAGLLLVGATLMALLVLAQFGFDFNALIAKAIEVHPQARQRSCCPAPRSPTRSRRSRSAWR